MRDVRDVAVIDQSPRVRDAMQTAFPNAAAFADLQSALPHIDALVVAVPAQRHAEVALEAIRNGKHVLVEKPLATSVGQAHLLIREAARANVVLMTGHTFSFNPAVRELKRRMDRGDLGQIYYIHSARLNLGLYRPDVNVVWDLAPHDFSILRFLFGALPERAVHGSIVAGLLALWLAFLAAFVLAALTAWVLGPEADAAFNCDVFYADEHDTAEHRALGFFEPADLGGVDTSG